MQNNGAIVELSVEDKLEEKKIDEDQDLKAEVEGLPSVENVADIIEKIPKKLIDQPVMIEAKEIVSEVILDPEDDC